MKRPGGVCDLDIIDTNPRNLLKQKKEKDALHRTYLNEIINKTTIDLQLLSEVCVL